MSKSRLPAVAGWEAVRAFERAGFHVDRVKGSHPVLKKQGCRYVISIPVHEGRIVPRGLLRRQIRLAGLSEEEFVRLL